MSQDDNPKDDWSFQDWIILIFLALMLAGLLSLLFSPPGPVEPGWLER